MWFVWLSVGVALGVVLAALLNGAREGSTAEDFSDDSGIESVR